jgi:CHAD domain-containing protein
MSKTSQIAWNPRWGAAQNARRQLPRSVRAYFTQVRELLAANPAPPELHAIRLATKRLRYTLELFRPCYGSGLEIRLAALQRLQQMLGEINDCAAAERLIDATIPASAACREVQSFLRRRASAKAKTLRKEWHENFDAPGREHWWTKYLANNARTGNLRTGSTGVRNSSRSPRL